MSELETPPIQPEALPDPARYLTQRDADLDAARRLLGKSRIKAADAVSLRLRAAALDQQMYLELQRLKRAPTSGLRVKTAPDGSVQLDVFADTTDLDALTTDELRDFIVAETERLRSESGATVADSAGSTAD